MKLHEITFDNFSDVIVYDLKLPSQKNTPRKAKI